MTQGESEEYESEDSFDWDLVSIDSSLDIGLDKYAMETLRNFIYFNSSCADDFIEVSHQDRFEATCYNDAYAVDEIAGNFGTNIQADRLNSIMDGLNEEHCTSPLRSPSCGLCVLGNLHIPSRENATPRRCLIRNARDRNRISRKRRNAWSSCRSTKTLMSRTSESLNGSGRWLLDHHQYCKWLDQASSFLWLCGRPGAGKSVLMSTVVHNLAKRRRPGDLLVYYFANGNYRGVSTAKAIFYSILGQLLVREPVRDSFAEVMPVLNELIAAGNSLTLASVASLFSKIRHMLRSYEILYLLLDGLDEAVQSSLDRELVLEIIDHASRHDPIHQVKCFISSRSTFFGDRLPKGALQVDLDSHQLLNRNDMSKYVQERLHRIVFPYHSRDYVELEELVLNSASGSFLILRLILQHAGQSVGNSAAIKNFLLDLNVAGELGLRTLYTGMLARIEDCNKEAVLYLLRWITFATRPLELDELVALCKDAGTAIKERDINTVSAGLLIRVGNQIQFTHLSVREYLESHLSDRWEELSEEANEMIAHACLKLLSTQDILQSLNLPTKSLSCSESVTTLHSVPYAQTHWMFHYKRAEQRSTYLAGLLHDTLERGINHSKDKSQRLEDEPKQYTRSRSDRVEGTQNPRVGYRKSDVESLNILSIALRISAQYGFSKLAQLELDMGADVNEPFGPEELTPLCLAAREGHLEVVRLLLQRGADPLMASGSGMIPIAYAMANCHNEIQEILTLSALQWSQRTNNPPDWIGMQDIQDFWLTAVLSTSLCTSCPSIRVDYELQAEPEVWDDTGEVLPAIMVSGQTVSESELQFLIGPTNTRRVSLVVRWYTGAQMYHVLRSVSKRGIDDVRKLLLAAGNREDSLDMVISVSKLLAKSTL